MGGYGLQLQSQGDWQFANNNSHFQLYLKIRFIIIRFYECFDWFDLFTFGLLLHSVILFGAEQRLFALPRRKHCQRA